MSTIKSEIIAQTWTGSANVVFPTGSVAVVPSIETAMGSAVRSMRPPICLIELSSADSDPEHDEEPDWLRLNVRVRVVTVGPGDVVGEKPLIGANKSGGATKSEGRGLLEVEQELYNAIGKLNALESVTLQFRKKGDVGTGFADEAFSLFVAFRDYTFEAWVTAT